MRIYGSTITYEGIFTGFLHHLWARVSALAVRIGEMNLQLSLSICLAGLQRGLYALREILLPARGLRKGQHLASARAVCGLLEPSRMTQPRHHSLVLQQRAGSTCEGF